MNAQRLLTIILLSAGIFIGAVHVTTAQAESARAPGCSIQFIYGHEMCYAPANVDQAERQVPFAVRPSSVMKERLHLSLAQVIVWIDPQGSKQIRYIYGALIPGGDYGRSHAQPKAVVVGEARGRVQPQPVLTRLYRGVSMTLSQAAVHPFRWYGPWYLQANFPHRQVTLSITANVERRTLMDLAWHILADGSSGK